MRYGDPVTKLRYAGTFALLVVCGLAVVAATLLWKPHQHKASPVFVNPAVASAISQGAIPDAERAVESQLVQNNATVTNISLYKPVYADSSGVLVPLTVTLLGPAPQNQVATLHVAVVFARGGLQVSNIVRIP